MRSKTYALRSWRKNHSSASIDIWSLQKQTHLKMVRDIKFDFEELHYLFQSIYRVIFEWTHQKMIIFRPQNKELKRLVEQNFALTSDEQPFNNFCLFWALPCHIDDASWAAFCVEVKFRQDKKHKNGSVNFFSFRGAQCPECKEVATLTQNIQQRRNCEISGCEKG